MDLPHTHSPPATIGACGGTAALCNGSDAYAGLDARLLAVNSYDDTIRVYDRGYCAPAALVPPPSDGRDPLSAAPSLDASPGARASSARTSSGREGDEAPHEREGAREGARVSGDGFYYDGHGGEPPASPTNGCASNVCASNESSRSGSSHGGGGRAAGCAVGGGDGGGGNGSVHGGMSEGMPRGSTSDGGMMEGEEGGEEGGSDARCIHALTGHRNRSLPIRSAMRVGVDYCRGPSSRRAHAAVVDSFPNEEAERWGTRAEPERPAMPTVHSSLLLATGSADGDAYVYDVGGPSGSGELIQRLRGHSDRVYAVGFHPTEPVLASGSADFTVRLWAPPARSRAGRARGGTRNAFG